MVTLIKRLTLDITADEHRRLKTMASFYGVTMKDFLLSKVIDYEKSEKRTRHDSKTKNGTLYLFRSARNKKRLLQSATRNGKGRKSFNSIKELKHALGI